MSDEIRNQNVACVSLEGTEWRAHIGPPGLGLSARAATPARALRALGALLEIRGWPFDPSWRPSAGVPAFHDA